MKSIERQPKTRSMPFAVRPLEGRDIPQSAEIERDAFPSLLPPTPFRRELSNRMASYLVAWHRDDVDDQIASEGRAPDSPPFNANRPLINRLLDGARGLWHGRPSPWEQGQQFVVGFLGTWYMVDEAHIVSVGVRREHRGKGIGELLLIGAIEQALAREARLMTLEVRVSNHVAMNLYLKYGFKQRGIRKGYYTDNREDAIIMTTDSILTVQYVDDFRRLVEVHERRWGHAERVLA